MQLLLLRHPEVFNPLNLCYGQMDMDLKEVNPQNVLELKNEIDSLKPIRVFSSISNRTLFLAEKLNLHPVQKDSRLNEIHFGQWEGKPWMEIPEKEINPWMYNYYFKATIQGESYSDLFIRIDSFLDECIFPFQFLDQRILLISHSGPIQCILSRFLNINAYTIKQMTIPFSKIWKIELGRNQRPIVYPPK